MERYEQSTGINIRFSADDGDPHVTEVEYVGNANTTLDMVEGARALLVRAADFVNTDDGYHYEAEAASLCYTLVTGASDMLASEHHAGPGFDETYSGLLLAHVIQLLKDNPCPMWSGGG